MGTISAPHRVVAQQQVLHAPNVATKLHTLRLLQIWQWEGMTLDSAIALCHRYGFTGLLVKALDGANWMNTFDPSPDALRSIPQVDAQARAAHAAGLYYFCWTNPLQTQIDVQTTRTALIAGYSDGVFLDVEPYSQFWGANAPVGRARDFMLAIRALAPNAFIALQPDPRLNALLDIRIAEWLPFCDALSGQHYWSDFATNPTVELGRARVLGEQYGIPVLPTLPGNAPWASFPLDLISLFPGFVVWRMGSTPANTLSMVGGVPVTGLRAERIRWSP